MQPELNGFHPIRRAIQRLEERLQRRKLRTPDALAPQRPPRPDGLLDFMENHDGFQTEISQTDQLYVRTQFKSFFDNVHLNFPTALSASPDENILWLCTPTVPRSIGDKRVDEYWNITIRKDNNSKKRSIRLDRQERPFRIDAYTSFTLRQQFIYTLDADGIVRRTTNLNWSPHDFFDWKAEESARRQNQPIGPKEFHGLSTLITDPGVTIKYNFSEEQARRSLLPTDLDEPLL